MATALTSLNASQGSSNLGEVQSERQTKASSLFQYPIPGEDSKDAVLLDIMGVLRNVTIESVKNDTAANIKTFIENIEITQNGSQGSGLVFTSSLLGEMDGKFYIDNFDWSYIAGEPTIVKFTMHLIQGSV